MQKKRQKNYITKNSENAEKKKRFRKTRIVFFTFFCLFCFGFIFVVSYFLGLDDWKNFDPSDVAKMDQSTIIYDSDGQEITTVYATQNRINISLSTIPKDVINAFLAVEDARFYEHNGVDVIRILGSLVNDIKSMSLKEGASTISQQLIKNTVLTNKKTFDRKLQEAFMAIELESAYSKDEILELYLNNVYFGSGAYGIEAASLKYFSKHASELTLIEGVALVATLKAPSNYAPDVKPEANAQRRNLILSLMVENEFLSQEAADHTKNLSLTLNEKDFSVYPHGYYADLALSEAESLLSLSTSEVLTGGYKIYTCLDTQLQSYLEEIFTNDKNFPANAADGEKAQAAVVIMDPDTGSISAIMGGREYNGRRLLNRAVDVRRQPGSAIKPVLVYAPAIEKLNYSPTTFLLDEEADFSGYKPKNSSGKYSGWVTMREAVTKSLNVPAVKLLNYIGIDTAKRYASNVGIRFNEGDDNLTLALGGFTQGVSVLELCAAYTPFASNGYYSIPYCITKIEKDGKVIYENTSSKKNVLSAESSYLMTSMLQSVVKDGTAKELASLNMNLAAKTGTSGDTGQSYNKDAWIISYNNEYIIGCWMGYDKTDEQHNLDSSVTGGTYPARLVKNIYAHIYENKESPTFTMPSGIVTADIDLKALSTNKQALLATSLTPKSQTMTEYYKTGSAPTAYTSLWQTPKAPTDLNLYISIEGLPMLSFSTSDSLATYRLIRVDETGAKRVIGEYDYSSQKIWVTDNTAKTDKVYLYYILPFNKEITSYGEPLSGSLSRTVSFPADAQSLN